MGIMMEWGARGERTSRAISIHARGRRLDLSFIGKVNNEYPLLSFIRANHVFHFTGTRPARDGIRRDH